MPTLSFPVSLHLARWELSPPAQIPSQALLLDLSCFDTLLDVSVPLFVCILFFPAPLLL